MILVRLKGGLGNQMFQYAAALALAKKHNTHVEFDLTLLNDKTPYSDKVYRTFELGVFNLKINLAEEKIIQYYNPERGSIFKRIKNKITKAIQRPIVYIEKTHRFDEDFFLLPDNSCIVGAFQSEKYFLAIADSVKRAFAFAVAFPKNILELADRIENCNSVCIHVRRGDYVTNNLYRDLLGAMSAEYYMQAFGFVTGVAENAEIFIFSDDIEWCKSNLFFKQAVTYVGDVLAESNYQAELFLMSKCRHFVISNSTFGWWGAWLSSREGKLVVAPKKWFKNESKDGEDIVPKNWISI
ncbi:MAG TPA: alpha-1,2-fucosyltransferase [Bacteroidia bacterium]